MLELLRQFGVDWKLLLAQIVNFAILLAVLRIFAYKPILKVLRDRQQKIRDGLLASEESERKLAETEESQKAILLKAEQNGFALVEEARKAAGEEEARLLDAAHHKAEQVIAGGQKTLEYQRAELVSLFEKEAEGLLRDSVAKVLAGMKPEERDAVLISNTLTELKKALNS
jgi:F-type H+-transporting ATPase subunit b